MRASSAAMRCSVSICPPIRSRFTAAIRSESMARRRRLLTAAQLHVQLQKNERGFGKPQIGEGRDMLSKPKAAHTGPVTDLDRSVLFLTTAFANKLAKGASRRLKKALGIGLMEWRVVCCIGAETGISA